MTISTVLDWGLLIIGLLGCVGTLRGWPFFMNPSRMENLIAQFGEDRIRRVVAVGYLLAGLLGAARVIGG